MADNINTNNFDSTEVAVLLETVNKYTPSFHKFRMQSVVGLEENSDGDQTQIISTSNIINKNKSSLHLSPVTTSNIIVLELPKEVTRNYPVKFIPPGTRFIVSFTGGDITKPVIIGREFLNESV